MGTRRFGFSTWALATAALATAATTLLVSERTLAGSTELERGRPEVAAQSALADFDGDGILDEISAISWPSDVDNDGWTSSLSLARGLPGGGFDAPARYDIVTWGYSVSDLVFRQVTLVDYDRDGRPDVLVALGGFMGGCCNFGYAAALHNRGDGTLEIATRGDADGDVRVIGVGDVNGDGLLDLVSMCEVDWSGAASFEGTQVQFGSPGGAFSGRVVQQIDDFGAIAWGGVTLLLMDLDRDGLQDIVLAENQGFEWYRSVGDGTFGFRSHRSGDPRVGIELEEWSVERGTQGVVLHWRIGRQAREAYVGLQIEAAPAEDGPFAPVLGGTLGLDSETWIDATVAPVESRWYRLALISANGTRENSRAIEAAPAPLDGASLSVVGVRTPVIQYRVVMPGTMAIEIYDVQGRRVRSLLRRETGGESGAITWDGEDDAGVRVASGMYLVRLDAGGCVLAHKVGLIRAR